MSYRTDLDHFVRKYEKKHGVKLTEEQAKYEYFKGRRISWAVFFGICGALTLGFELWLILFPERYDYVFTAWILIGLLVLFNLWQVCSSLKEIREYSAPKKRKPLTRAILAERCRDTRASVKDIAISLAFLCAGLPVGILCLDSWLCVIGIIVSAFSAFFAVYSLVKIPADAKARKRILCGDFLFASSVAQSIVGEDNADNSVTLYYIQFSTGLPAGDYGKPGYYYDINCPDAEVGKRYYLVLFKSRILAKIDVEEYDLRLGLPADEWEPDDDLRQLLREM